MATNVTTTPVWKKDGRASEASYEFHKRQKTRRNWKNSYGFDIPDEKFEAFKANKKLYIQLRQIKEQLDKDLLAMVLGED